MGFREFLRKRNGARVRKGFAKAARFGSRAGRVGAKQAARAARVASRVSIRAGKIGARQTRRLVRSQARKGSIVRRGFAGIANEGRIASGRPLRRKVRRGRGRTIIIREVQAPRQEEQPRRFQRREAPRRAPTPAINPLGEPSRSTQSNGTKKKVGGLQLF